ncbi:MAG: Lrp/AsnC family transcriptional regulator [Terrimesophilobacter sp.]
MGPNAGKPMQLDDVSKAIIEQLQTDGRRSYAEIGKAVGLSEAAVRQRVQKLTDSGVLQIVAVTDPMQLGFYRQAMIGVRVAGDATSVADRLSQISAVDYVVLTAGSFDILAEVVCENDDDLIDLLNREIRGIPGVQSTETFVYLKLQKQFYNWGTR